MDLVLSKLVVAVVVMVLLAFSVTPRHRLSKKSGDKHQGGWEAVVVACPQQ